MLELYELTNKVISQLRDNEEILYYSPCTFMRGNFSIEVDIEWFIKCSIQDGMSDFQIVSESIFDITHRIEKKEKRHLELQKGNNLKTFYSNYYDFQ